MQVSDSQDNTITAFLPILATFMQIQNKKQMSFLCKNLISHTVLILEKLPNVKHSLVKETHTLA